MSIENPNFGDNLTPENIEEAEKKKEEMIKIAQELSESWEHFTFFGIEDESYQNLKSEEEEFPGYVTPIDELIERFKKEGMRVVLGDYPENVYVMPAQSYLGPASNDVPIDGIFIRHLQINEEMNENLKKLIEMKKN